jgi:hypothetical protein
VIEVTRDDVRRLMETAFEPHGSGFVYYRNIFTGGVPVTVEERELFVADWSTARSAEFHRLIAGRAPVTPPRGLKAAGAMVRAMPSRIAYAIVIGAGAAVALGSRAEADWIRSLLWALGALLFACAAGVFILRRFRD